MFQIYIYHNYTLFRVLLAIDNYNIDILIPDSFITAFSTSASIRAPSLIAIAILSKRRNKI